MPLAFAFYMLITLHWLNYFHGHNIPGLKAKEKAEAAEKEARERDIDLMLKQFRALRKDVEDGHLATPNLVGSLNEEAVAAAAAAAAAGRPSGSGVEMVSTNRQATEV